ncbi:type II secretion system GspH family protein [Massilia sp. MB5]|uniref:type II secretion system protein n=1 Tax=Massilia sp. MB5 TaxID=2919578 RepID=UPI001F0DCB4C|nr:type II secretion system protein [Massilia sp. MB5]UMR29086.1 type II secretion system GspH family protein [Massilia sp. MB5]
MKARRADWPAVAAAQRRGFSLFELGVVLIVVAILGTVFLQRVLFYQEEAERAAVAQVLAQLRAGVLGKVAELHLRGKTGDLSGFSGQNPMLWLARQPPNYLGELNAPETSELQTGNWYFDRAEKTLLYLPAQRGLFVDKTLKPLKFRLKAGASIQTNSPNSGLSLEQVVDN